MNDAERSIMPIDPIFRDDKEFRPLQLVDVWATLLRKAQLGDKSWDWVLADMHGIKKSKHDNIDNERRLTRISEIGREQIPQEMFEIIHRVFATAEDQL